MRHLEGACVRRILHTWQMLWGILVVITILQLVMTPNAAGAALVVAPFSSSDPTLMFIPNPAHPGSTVEASGAGFGLGLVSCNIVYITFSFYSPIQGAQCFVRKGGNVTGVFQVSASASPGNYNITVIVTTNSSYMPPKPVYQNLIIQPIQAVTRTISATISTTVLTTAAYAYTQTSTEMATTTAHTVSQFTWLQAIVTVSLTAAATVLLYHTIVWNATRRIQIRKRQLGPAFDIEVKSGVDRKENPVE